MKKSLSDRIHKCPHCGLIMDRDLNASKNILKIGRGPPESKPAEEKDHYTANGGASLSSETGSRPTCREVVHLGILVQ